MDTSIDLPPGTRVRFRDWGGFSDYLSIPEGTLGTVLPRVIAYGFRVQWDSGKVAEVWGECLDVVSAAPVR